MHVHKPKKEIIIYTKNPQKFKSNVQHTQRNSVETNIALDSLITNIKIFKESV